MKIAILEDNPAIIEYMRIALEMKGHHIQVFTHGAHLLETLFPASGIASPMPFDLLTVDLLLPGGLSGRQVMTRIRAAIPAHRLPIIVISGASLHVLEEVQREFPEMPVLSKPFKLTMLVRLLEQVHVAAQSGTHPEGEPLPFSGKA